MHSALFYQFCTTQDYADLQSSLFVNNLSITSEKKRAMLQGRYTVNTHTH
jgi:hypothetical protein